MQGNRIQNNIAFLQAVLLVKIVPEIAIGNCRIRMALGCLTECILKGLRLNNRYLQTHPPYHLLQEFLLDRALEHGHPHTVQVVNIFDLLGFSRING